MLTPSFGELREEYDAVIHAVAPNYREMDDESECDALLRDAYRASMRRAKGQMCKTVAFTLLSAGVGRGKRDGRPVRVGAGAGEPGRGLQESCRCPL